MRDDFNVQGACFAHVVGGTSVPPSHLYPGHGTMLLRLATGPLGARKRHDIVGAENFFLPLDANVYFVSGNEQAGRFSGVLVLSSRSDAADIFLRVGIDRPPKDLLFGVTGDWTMYVLCNRHEEVCCAGSWFDGTACIA